jgi:hypothetical protein
VEGEEMKPTMKQVRHWLQANLDSGDSQRIIVGELMENIRENCQDWDQMDDAETIRHMVDCAKGIIVEAQAFIDTFEPEPEA